MKLTTKGRFAVTAMLDVALHGTEKPVSLAAVSARRHISLPYLEQLFTKLRRSGLVESVRGAGGGYRLCQAAERVSIARIILAAEDTLDATQCGGAGNCHNGAPCLSHDLWENFNLAVDFYLSQISLADVLHNRLPPPQQIRRHIPPLKETHHEHKDTDLS